MKKKNEINTLLTSIHMLPIWVNNKNSLSDCNRQDRYLNHWPNSRLLLLFGTVLNQLHSQAVQFSVWGGLTKIHIVCVVKITLFLITLSEGPR